LAAYYIVDLEVTDAGEFEEYRRLVAPMVANYGGRYVVRGGALETVEGDWSPNRLVILEFDCMERLKSWYESDEYRPVKAIRHRSAISKAVIVEGIV
jgi:uncharacterized protein (DUF1330 family)